MIALIDLMFYVYDAYVDGHMMAIIYDDFCGCYMYGCFYIFIIFMYDARCNVW